MCHKNILEYHLDWELYVTNVLVYKYLGMNKNANKLQPFFIRYLKRGYNKIINSHLKQMKNYTRWYLRGYSVRSYSINLFTKYDLYFNIRINKRL